jgi:lactate oxidase
LERLRSAVLCGGALTLSGAGGVAGLVDYFNRELVNTILHLGIDKVAALGREHVRPHRG